MRMAEQNLMLSIASQIYYLQITYLYRIPSENGSMDVLLSHAQI